MRWASWLWATLSAVLVAALYVPSLSGGFLADDWAMIVDNEARMTGLSALGRFFTAGVWESSNLGRSDSALYRPLWLVWNFILYNLFGEDPLYWRAASLALHILNTALVAVLLGALFPAVGPLERALGALIFAVHPVKPQSVAWISGSTDVLLTAFFLAAVLLFLRYRRTASPMALAGTALCALGAMLTKEPGVVLPLVLLAVDLWADARAPDRRPAHWWLRTYGLLGAIALGYLALRSLVLGGALQGQGNLVLSGETLARLVEYGFAYLRLLFVPWPVPYYFRHVPGGIAGPWSYGLGALVLLVLLWALWRGGVARVAALWIALTLAAPLALALHRLGVFGPRFLYLPSVGATLLVVAGYLWLKARLHRMALAVPASAFAALAGLTFAELPVWRDELTWTAHALQSNPAGRYGWLARAGHYERLGQPERAMETYRSAIAAVVGTEEKASLHERLGILQAEHGRYEDSLATYEALRTLPGHAAEGFVGIGNNHWSVGRYEEAFKAYDNALDRDPTNALALYNRARLSEARGDSAAALAHYRRLLALPGEARFESARAHARAYLQREGGTSGSSSNP